MPDSRWSIGDVVRDRDDDDPNPDSAIVVNTPDASADEWDIPRFGTTVAEDNPDYPTDAPIVTVVFEENLTDSFPNWTGDNRISYATLAERSVQYYSFPGPRLGPADLTTATDPEIETDADETDDATAEADTATSTPDQSADPSDAVRALKERLDDGGMTTELEDDDQTIRATKLGETYRLRPGEVLDGDGAFRNRLEEIVGEDPEVSN